MKGPAQQPQGFLGNAAPRRFSSFGTPPAGGFGAPTPTTAGTGAALTSPTQGWMNKPNVGTWTPGAGQPPWAGNSWGRSTGDPLATALTTGRTGSWKANGEWSPGGENGSAAPVANGATPAATPNASGTAISGAPAAGAATPAAQNATPAAPSFGDPALQAQYTNEQLWAQGLGNRPTFTPPSTAWPAPPGPNLRVWNGPGTSPTTPTTPQTNIQSQYRDLAAAIPQAAPAINQLLGNPQGQQTLEQYIAANSGKLSPELYAQLKAGGIPLP